MPDDKTGTPGGAEEEKKSKTRRKKEMEALRHLGEKLLDLPEEQLASLSDPDLIEAVKTCKRITRGNARKRQIQYIGKLMRGTDVDAVQALVDRFDAGSRQHTIVFHKLERWRWQLMDGDPQAMQEVIDECPHVDRQHLNQLIRSAAKEQENATEPPVHFRKLFQYLKLLVDE